ncbi:glutathione S-transferase family protein, partial [Thioclava sp. BHET1]
VDAYGYRPLVRQVYEQRVFAPALGEPPEDQVVAEGLARAGPVLAALEEIATEGLVLNGAALTLADLYLAPMIAAFVQAPEGAAALIPHQALSRWWRWMAGRRAMATTDPGLPG